MPSVVEVPFREIIITFEEDRECVTLSDFVIVRIVNYVDALNV